MRRAMLDTATRVGILDREILRWSLKALLCGRGDEWRRFDALFDAYFLPPNKRAFAASRAAATGAVAGERRARAMQTGSLPIGTAGRAAASDDDGVAERHGASREESLASTDFRDLDRADQVRDIEALMRRFARRLKRLQLRREARFDHGRRLDLRGTIRRSVASGGTPFRLAWKDRRRVRPRLVLLLDVSRSMSQYSFFYLRLARALCAELADVHCFIFHTRITGVREALRDPDPWRSQERLHLLAAGWGGGTRIGECLQDFNRRDGSRLVHSRTGGDRRQRRLRHRRARRPGGGARHAAAAGAAHRLAQPVARPPRFQSRSPAACRRRCRTSTSSRRAPTWRASSIYCPV